MLSFLKQPDKLSHFLVGATLTFTMALFFPMYIALLVTLVVGTGKEVWDSFGNGCVEFKDALATWLGGIYAMLIYTIQWVI